MSLVINTEPAAEPVTVQECKDQGRITTAAEDTLLGRYITAARRQVERITNRQLITATWDLYADSFCDPQYFRMGALQIPRPPLQSISLIEYVDSAGATQTWASTNYRVDIKSNPGRVTTEYPATWPTIRPVTNAVHVRFVAGYGAAGSAVPPEIKHAMILLVVHWYDNRALISDTVGEKASLPFAVNALLSSYRIGLLAA